jgi:cystathionine beta-lyase
MNYDFDALIPRRSTDSVKWNYYDENVLPLWVADMDFRSPEPVLQALHERVSHGIFGYPTIIAMKNNLGEIIVERMQRLFGWRISTDDLVFIPGVVTGLNLVAHGLAHSGDGLLIQTPVYPPFLRLAENAGLLAQEMELTCQADGSYAIDWDVFEAAITPQTRVFVLCNPHNPVGRVFRREELERIAEICLRKGVLICSDEIHCDLLYRGQQHIPIASLDGEVAKKTVTLMAPSKTFNIAGLQCSFAIVPDKTLREKLQHAHEGLAGWVNLMGPVAAVAAYQEGQEWLDQLLQYLEGNRDFLADYVAENLPGVKMWRPEGTYLGWLDCRGVDLPEPPGEFFLKKAQVGLNEGHTFGKGGEGFVRLNFGCPRSILVEALERMREALMALS